jgi:cell division transport system permease protein
MNNEEKRMDDQIQETVTPEETLPAENIPEAAEPQTLDELTPIEEAADEFLDEPLEELDLSSPVEEESEEFLDFSVEDVEEEEEPEPSEQADPTTQTVRLDGEEIAVSALLADFRESAPEDEGLMSVELPSEEKPSDPAADKPEEHQPPKESQPVPEPTVKLNPEEYLIDTPAYMGLEGSMPKQKRRKRHAHFLYYIAEALRGMKAHSFMSFAAVGIITACLLLMGCFAMVVLNLNVTLNNLMDRNEFLAYVDESYSQEEAESLQSAIESVPNVSEVTFITKEEAKASYIEGLGDNDLYSDLPDYIFRDRFSIHVDDLELIEDTIEEVRALDGIVNISAELDVAKGFVTVRNIAMVVAAILVMILFVISLFIMSNTIKLATINRGDEIAIMRMCGATNRFIRWPFVYEGAILGLLGAGISYGLLRALYYFVIRALNLSGKLSLISVISFQEVGNYVLVVFLAAGLIIGVGGSSGTIRKFLKV